MGFTNQRRDRLTYALVFSSLFSLLAGCSATPTLERSTPSQSSPIGSAPNLGPTATPVGRFADVQLGRLTADEAFSSSTIEDWVRQADHVAVVTIVDETALPPAKSEIERREGLIGRMVTARIDSLIWTHPITTRKLPALIRFQQFGWAFQGAVESKYRIGIPNRSYLLPGHTYLMGLRWFKWGCPGRIDPEDEVTPARYAPLGSGAIVPFDGSIGAGEFEGHWVSTAGQEDPPMSFRAAMAGQPVSWVSQQLSKTAAANPALAHPPGPIDCEGE